MFSIKKEIKYITMPTFCKEIAQRVGLIDCRDLSSCVAMKLEIMRLMIAR